MHFKVGEQVSLLHETGVFEVIEIQAITAIIKDEFLFERKVKITELVKRKEIPFIGNIHSKDDLTKPRSTKQIETALPQIDLHIEQLTQRDAGLSAHDKFLLQTDTFKRFTNQMIEKRISRFLVIHGIGEGKLIQEIRSLIRSKEGISMQDANYSARGVGASYIDIKLTVVEKF